MEVHGVAAAPRAPPHMHELLACFDVVPPILQPIIFVRYLESGVPVAVGYATWKTVAEVAADAVALLDEFIRVDIRADEIALFKATRVDRMVTVQGSALVHESTLEENGIAERDTLVCRLRAPAAAATGGAGASSGAWCRE